MSAAVITVAFSAILEIGRGERTIEASGSSGLLMKPRVSSESSSAKTGTMPLNMNASRAISSVFKTF
jgi:hypothetical protein